MVITPTKAREIKLFTAYLLLLKIKRIIKIIWFYHRNRKGQSINFYKFLSYYFLRVCAKSDAATLFAVALDLGLLKILEAFEATALDVCLLFGITLRITINVIVNWGSKVRYG